MGRHDILGAPACERVKNEYYTATLPRKWKISETKNSGEEPMANIPYSFCMEALQCMQVYLLLFYCVRSRRKNNVWEWPKNGVAAAAAACAHSVRFY